jgi:hypothetical protein
MATLRDLALAWSELMETQHPDQRGFTAQCLKAMFDASAALEIHDNLDLPRVDPTAESELRERKKQLHLVRSSMVDGLIGDPVPLSIAKIVVERFEATIRAYPEA